MSSDPYSAPLTTEYLPEQRDRRWRGTLWFTLPLLALIAIATAIDYISGRVDMADWQDFAEILVVVMMPAGIAGFACHRRCRTTSWPRYLAWVLLAGLGWAAFFSIALTLRMGDWHVSPGRLAALTGRAALIVVPLTLLIASTLRFYDRRRP